MGYKYKDMTRLLKRNCELVGIAKKTMTDLIHRLELIMIALKKNSGN